MQYKWHTLPTWLIVWSKPNKIRNMMTVFSFCDKLDCLFNYEFSFVVWRKCKPCPSGKQTSFVCGSDNRTYSSACRLDYHNCVHNSLIKVNCKGFCPCKGKLDSSLPSFWIINFVNFSVEDEFLERSIYKFFCVKEKNSFPKVLRKKNNSSIE